MFSFKGNGELCRQNVLLLPEKNVVWMYIIFVITRLMFVICIWMISLHMLSEISYIFRRVRALLLATVYSEVFLISVNTFAMYWKCIQTCAIENARWTKEPVVGHYDKTNPLSLDRTSAERCFTYHKQQNQQKKWRPTYGHTVTIVFKSNWHNNHDNAKIFVYIFTLYCLCNDMDWIIYTFQC